MLKKRRTSTRKSCNVWIKAVTAVVFCLFVAMSIDMGVSAAMRKEVLSSTTTLPEANEFNVIAEPFAWGKDVTRVMLNPGVTVNKNEVSAGDFTVNATHYSEQAWTNDYQGPRTVLDAYPVDAEGNKVDSGDYIIIELEYGSNVDSSHTGSYDYANFYTPLKLTYDVKWSVTGDKYTQNDVVNLVCDEFVLDRHVDTSIADSNFNFCDYAFYAPKKDNKKHPLIIFFHGMGEGGAGSLNNKGVQMYAYQEVAFAEPEIQGIMGNAYVLLPQSPDRWPTNGFTSESAYLEVVNSLIDATIADNPDIDQDRIYVGGLSMGGFMAARVILSRPDKYAAAVLCAQAYAITEEDAERLKTLPIWISCCESDYTCAMDPYTYKSYTNLVAAGGVNKMCAVMEDNSSDPSSRFRFYAWNKEDYVLYDATQEHENKITGEFVWDNVGYSGHNGGWVPVFANGQYYMDDNNNKITVMEWVAAQNLISEVFVDASKAKTVYTVGEAFDASNLEVGITYRTGFQEPLTPDYYTVTAPDMSVPGVHPVTVTHGSVKTTYNITIKAVQAAPVPAPTVTQQPSVSVVLSTNSAVLYNKGTNKLALNATVTGTTGAVVWTSSNTKVATVSDTGVVKAKKAGTAVITATVGSVKSECTVTVKNVKFKIAKSKLKIKKGKAAKIKVTVSPKAKVKYKSASSKIAKVNSKGVVKGLKKGNTKITVTAFGIKKVIKVTIK